MIHITKGLEPFWDTYLIDTNATNAVLSSNKLKKTDIVFSCDKPWEGDCTNFFTIFKDGDIYRMYYEAWSMKGEFCINVCYAESRDGLTWEKPELGICEYGGNTANNIIIKNIPDNITVMKDQNPDCPPEMRYKAVMSVVEDTYLHNGNKANALKCMVSPDGIHFTDHALISQGLAYDTQNSLHWNPHSKKYYCYMRNYHPKKQNPDNTFNESDIRGISVIESSDFINWSKPEPLNFGAGEDYPLYTNCVAAYLYDTRFYVGFPTRYVERREWTKNYDRLCGKEQRLERMKSAIGTRVGLVITDCVFMSSRDNINWHRFDEACITPGLEYEYNWLYGDCYPALGGIIETPAKFPDEPNELSLFVYNHHFTDRTTELVRYTCRRDGFASVKAGYEWKKLVTKPFTFDAETLKLNFATSARGSIYLRVLDELNNPIDGYSTCEIFGDTLERIVDFDKPLSELCGRHVKFEFTMRDAEIFAMRFC